MSALVLGAGGFLGLNLVEALCAAGETPRCGRRRAGNVLALRRLRVPLVAADLEEPQELRTAMSGCDTVFHLAGHYPRLSVDGAATLETGLRQTRNVLESASAAGVRRLLYVSSTATVAPADGRPSTEANVHSSLPHLGVYHSVKWAMEQAVLAESRFETAVLCPGACLGPWDLKIGTSALVVALARGMDPPHPDGVINVVDVRDVAFALVRLSGLRQLPPRLLLAAENHSLHALMVRLSRWYGVPPPRPPLSAAEAVAFADEEEQRSAGERRRPRLSREIVDLVVHGCPVDSSWAESLLGLQWTPLNQSLEAFDAWARRLQILPTDSTRSSAHEW